MFFFCCPVIWQWSCRSPWLTPSLPSRPLPAAPSRPPQAVRGMHPWIRTSFSSIPSKKTLKSSSCYFSNLGPAPRDLNSSQCVLPIRQRFLADRSACLQTLQPVYFFGYPIELWVLYFVLLLSINSIHLLSYWSFSLHCFDCAAFPSLFCLSFVFTNTFRLCYGQSCYISFLFY